MTPGSAESVLVSLDRIRQAQQRIAGVAVRTPLISCPAPGREFFLKPENLQPMGAFKLRGAYNMVASLPPDVRARGVISYSSGNHAQAVAFAARAMGVKAVIVMPDNAPPVKRSATAALGAEIVIVGPSGSERQAKAEELSAAHGYAMVPPFNHLDIIAGQGTIGLEILEDMPTVQLVLSPVSGGGLLSGIAAAIKQANPAVKVIGVEPALANDAQQSLRSGSLVALSAKETSRTIADGLRTESLGVIPFEHVKRFVDDIVAVSEDEIRRAMAHIAMRARLVAEPSGAVSCAAALFHSSELPAGRTVAVLSGGNVEPALLADVLSSAV